MRRTTSRTARRTAVRRTVLRRTAAGLTAAALATTGLAVAAPSASADPEEVVRLYGTDRYATAVKVSQDLYGPDEAQAVVVARGDLFADGLAGVPLAAAKDGPLLLTQKSALNGRTSTEIDRVLTPGSTVYLLGSTAAIEEPVAQAIRNKGYTVVRIGGADRYTTAVLIAKETDPEPLDIFVTTGRSFPDALAAGAAAAGIGVVVLTNNASMPTVTRNYLTGDGADSFVTAVGSPAVSATGALADEQIAGSDRYETAAMVAAEVFGGFNDTVGLASGRNFPDALSGGVHAGLNGAPMLLTRTDALPGATQGYVDANAEAIDFGYVFGGPSVVSDTAVNQLRAAMAE